MSATRRWLLIGLLLGLALAAAILFVPGPWVEDVVTRSGLPGLTKLAQPPLGTKAYLLLAAAALAGGLALGWIAGRLFSRPREADPDADADVDVDDQPAGTAWRAAARAPAEPLPAPAPALDSLGWNAPAEAAPVAAAEALAPQVTAPEPTVPEPVAALAHEPAALHTAATAADAEETPMSLPPPSVSASPEAEPGAVLAPEAGSFSPIPPAPAPRLPVDPDPALARIESALAGLAQHGPVGVSARFDALDARLQQMAQQIAEVAALARAAQRTPASAVLPVAGPAALVPPADPARRRAMATAARTLLARMGDGIDPA